MRFLLLSLFLVTSAQAYDAKIDEFCGDFSAVQQRISREPASVNTMKEMADLIRAQRERDLLLSSASFKNFLKTKDALECTKKFPVLKAHL